MTILNPTQIIFVRQIRDYLPVVGHKLEPKQVWGLIQETRSRVMVRRGDKDGARLENYTKQDKIVCVGDSVGVQN